jgi:hypothetical protein
MPPRARTSGRPLLGRAYFTADGVHRALIAWHLGRKTIRALADSEGRDDQVEIDLHLAHLRAARERHTAAALVMGSLRDGFLRTIAGETPPPIQVISLAEIADDASARRLPTIPDLHHEAAEMIGAAEGWARKRSR